MKSVFLTVIFAGLKTFYMASTRVEKADTQFQLMPRMQWLHQMYIHFFAYTIVDTYLKVVIILKKWHLFKSDTYTKAALNGTRVWYSTVEYRAAKVVFTL